jgi:hypothetical protein
VELFNLLNLLKVLKVSKVLEEIAVRLPTGD